MTPPEHPDNNLACYCAQPGRLDECQQWFKKATAIDEHAVKRAAIDDPDLKPLGDSMSGTMWKRAGYRSATEFESISDERRLARRWIRSEDQKRG